MNYHLRWSIMRVSCKGTVSGRNERLWMSPPPHLILDTIHYSLPSYDPGNRGLRQRDIPVKQGVFLPGLLP